MKERLRSEGGFGMIELLISLTILNVAIVAILTAFSSGGVTLQNASRTATAATLAEKQMELYRAISYNSIALHSSLLTTAAANSTYAGDPAYVASQFSGTCTTPVPAECQPMQTVTGPDGRSYRVDTYIRLEAPPGGRDVKRITVVVRRSDTLQALTRITSTVDVASG